MESTFVLKMKDGADIIEEITKLADKQGIDYGLFISASGSLRKFELVGSVGEDKKFFKDSFDVDGISGRFQKKSKTAYDMNLRIALSTDSFTSKSGRLTKGIVSGKLEIGIRKIDMKKIIEA